MILAIYNVLIKKGDRIRLRKFTKGPGRQEKTPPHKAGGVQYKNPEHFNVCSR
jgi:hypothetical protein